MTVNQVVLVDENDKEIGTADKLIVHQKGLLHRAFSVFIFRRRADKLQLLLQQRQLSKYHCGGLWSNACCSHPRPNEPVLDAGERRLQEELGITTKLMQVDSFVYRAVLDNGLIEHEYDHILFGSLASEDFDFSKEEVMAVKWINVDCLLQLLSSTPSDFTPWFQPALSIALNSIAIINRMVDKEAAVTC